MSPAYIFTTDNKVTIMAMKSKNEKETEQINFDDLACEGGFTEEYSTITGKEQLYLPDYEVYKTYECDVGEELTGYPEVSIIPKKDKSYDSLKIRVIDDTSEEILEAYANFPRADEKGFVKRITKDFDFYRNAFDFLFSVRRCQGDKYVMDKNGEEYTSWNNIDFIGHAKLVDSKKRITIKVTEGNPDSSYDSWQIIRME